MLRALERNKAEKRAQHVKSGVRRGCSDPILYKEVRECLQKEEAAGIKVPRWNHAWGVLGRARKQDDWR